MSKTISNCIDETLIKDIFGDTYTELSGIAFDSRQVKNGYAFFAIRGTDHDGHHYIDQAIKSGATSIVAEELPDKKVDGVTYVKVSSSQQALGQAASHWYDDPSEDLTVVGVTGTNGKTTVATLLYQIMMMSGEKAGLVSTAETMIGAEQRPRTDNTPTTPDPITLHALLREMADEGCSYVVMEVSSHAMHQNRLSGVFFGAGIFTNITHDHLDYHGTFEAYLEAKQSFFDMLPETAFAVANIDDENGPFMLQNTKAAAYYYGLQNAADFDLDILSTDITGTEITINDRNISLPLPGAYNGYNAAAAYGAAVLLGVEEERLPKIMSKLVAPPGRFEVLKRRDGKLGILDYAHSPDALENLLQTVRDIDSKRRIITVLGAGGDRDASKRPLMGSIAARLSDYVILTSDNPRKENPLSIIDDIHDGISKEDQERVTISPNREEAIQAAVLLARSGDCVILAGKGHETYQDIYGTKIPFSDKEVFLEA